MPMQFRFTSWFTPPEYVSNIAHKVSKVMGAAQPLILSALIGAVFSSSIACTSAVKRVSSLLAKETDQDLVEKLIQTWEIP